MKSAVYDREGDLFCLDDTRLLRRVLLIFGLPFIVVGTLMLADVLFTWLFDSGQIAGGQIFATLLFLFFGGMISTLEFGRYLSGDGRYLITRHRYFFIRWEEKQPLAAYSHIQLKRVLSSSSGSNRTSAMYGIVLDTRYMDTELSADSDYVSARAKAEQLVKQFNLPLQDFTGGKPVITHPEDIDQTLTLRQTEMPLPPANSGIRMTYGRDGLRFVLPSRKGLPLVGIFRLLVIVFCGLFMQAKVGIDAPPAFMLAFSGVLFLIVAISVFESFYPYFFRPWIEFSKSGTRARLSAFSKPVDISLKALEEARVSPRGRVILRSDQFYAALPVHSSREDAEFVLQLFQWLATIEAASDSQPLNSTPTN